MTKSHKNKKANLHTLQVEIVVPSSPGVETRYFSFWPKVAAEKAENVAENTGTTLRSIRNGIVRKAFSSRCKVIAQDEDSRYEKQVTLVHLVYLKQALVSTLNNDLLTILRHEAMSAVYWFGS